MATALRMCAACGEHKRAEAFHTGKRRWLECDRCRQSRLEATRAKVGQKPPHPLEKVCRDCGVLKNKEAFVFRHSGQLTRYRARCRDCYNEWIRTRDSAPARAKTLYEQRKLDPEGYMVRTTRERAKRIGIEFSIRKADISIPEVCPVLGIALSRPGYGQCESSPTIDRLDPSKGYVPGNVAVISNRANRLKNNATAFEHAAIAAWMRSKGLS